MINDVLVETISIFGLFMGGRGAVAAKVLQVDSLSVFLYTQWS
jgi:hypothetical protein